MKRKWGKYNLHIEKIYPKKNHSKVIMSKEAFL